MIDVNKYFKPVVEDGVGCIDYDFQEHLTDYLLGDIIEQNKEMAKLQDVIKEIKYICENTCRNRCTDRYTTGCPSHWCGYGKIQEKLKEVIL